VINQLHFKSLHLTYLPPPSKFQLKVGGSPRDDIDRIRAVRSILDSKVLFLLRINGVHVSPQTFPQTVELRAKGEANLYMPLLCDANTGWRMHEALQVVNGVKDLDVYIEQPCLSYEECLSVRRLSPLPMVLDECMDDIGWCRVPCDCSFLCVKM
jgi:hypothetical protein